MSHDVEAAYAATEVVNYFLTNPASCFSTPPAARTLSAYAAREGRHSWPHADGVIELSVAAGATPTEYSVALEFKRPNEGLHGVLTAIGQSHAYLRKGYAGAVIVIPSAYSSLSDPGVYVREVLDLTSRAEGIGVFTYTRPDMLKTSPFSGKLQALRNLRLDGVAPVVAPRPITRTQTQWAHLREGSSEPDAFFKYLQAVKLLGGGGADPIVPKIPKKIRDAVERIRGAGADPERYLSSCPNNSLADVAWRHFWFKYILHDSAILGWMKNTAGEFDPIAQPSQIQKSDGSGPKMFFVGKSNSPKNKLAAALNSGALTEADAEKALVENYHSRAHSYREDIDSGCEHLGFVDSDGRLTDAGYRFVDACERYGHPNEGLPRALFLKAVLGEGSLGAFLHYIYRLSDERFKCDPLAFSNRARGSRTPAFEQAPYLQWLEGEMENSLRVIRKVSTRGGVARKPFQAELAVLRGLGIVGIGFRLGVGLIINWPELQDAMSFAETSYMQ
jgi:hypothetical protein